MKGDIYYVSIVPSALVPYVFMAGRFRALRMVDRLTVTETRAKSVSGNYLTPRRASLPL